VSTLVLWLVYLACAAALAAAARWLGRPIARRSFLVYLVLPVAFLFRGFVSDTTPIPIQDVRALVPWYSPVPPFGASGPKRNPNLNDVALQIAPWAKAARLAWKSGELPWLDRWNGCGTPLAANGQSAAFSPFTIVGFVLPLTRAFTLAAALKLLLALAGTGLWLSELGASPTAALVGGVGFGFSTVMTIWLPWPITAVVALWPWALFLIERANDERGRRRAVALLAAVLLAWALGGHPESAAVGAGFVAVWVACRLISRAWRRPGAVLRSTLLAGAIAMGLAAFLLVPEVNAIRGSNRRFIAEKSSAILADSWKPHRPWWRPGFVTPFFPKAYGDAIHAPMLPAAVFSFPEIGSAYPGAAIWVLVLLVLRPGSRRRREVWALAAIAAGATAAATRVWPFAEILSRVPGFSLMIPIRFHEWIPLCAAGMAAFELDRLRADVARHPRRGLWAAGGAVIFGILGLVVFLHLRPVYAALGGLRQEGKTLLVLAGALAIVAAAGIAASRYPARRGTRGDALLCAGFALSSIVELFALTQPLDRFGRSSLVFPETPLVRFLRSRPGVFRVVGIGAAMFPNSNVFAEVDDIRTHDPMERRDYVAFLDAAFGYPPDRYFKFVGNPDSDALDFLNVAYAIAPPGLPAPGKRWALAYSGADGVVFRNADVMPRVFGPQTARAPAHPGNPKANDAFEAFGASAADVVAGVDWHRDAVVVSGSSALPFPPPGAPNPVISGLRETTNRVLFDSTVPGRDLRLAVASEVQDGGWSARDEQGELPSGRANGPFFAFALRPGTHRVVLAYTPPGLRWGGAVSIVTAGIAAFVFFPRRRRR